MPNFTSSHRRHRRGLLLALPVLLGACGGSPTPVSSSAQRIVPGCASAVDYLCWLGAFARIVGLPEPALAYANGLPSDAVVRGVPVFAAFRAEPILALQPELVICDWYQSGEARSLLEANGIRVVVLCAVESLADIERNLTMVGSAIGDAAGTATAVARFAREVDAMRASAPAEGPIILPYFNHGSGARTAGRATIEALMIDLVGGRNAAELMGLRGHVALSVERVLSAPPDYFLTGEGGQQEALLASPFVGTLAGLDARHILVLPQRLRNAASPYVVAAARALADALADAEARVR